MSKHTFQAGTVKEGLGATSSVPNFTTNYYEEDGVSHSDFVLNSIKSVICDLVSSHILCVKQCHTVQLINPFLLCYAGCKRHRCYCE